MIRTHEYALSRRIDELAWKGFCFIEWWELQLWYGAERIGKTVWHDLKDRFDEAAEDSSAELYIYEFTGSSGVLLIHSDGLKTITEKIAGNGSGKLDSRDAAE